MSFTILHVDSSPKGDQSFSRALSAAAVTALKALHPEATIIRRDLAASPLPHLTAAMIESFYVPPESRTAEQKAVLSVSDEMVDEMIAADVIVLGVPMWNFGIPSGTKAWIDHVTRPGRTFHYTEKGPVGLLDVHKKVIVASSRGGVYSTGAIQSMDFQEPYLKTILGFMGLTNVSFVRAEGVGKGTLTIPDAVAAAQPTLKVLAA